MCDTLLTTAEAAQILRMLPARLARLAKAGKLPTVLLPDGELRFDRGDLRGWIDQHKRPIDGGAVAKPAPLSGRGRKRQAAKGVPND